MPEHPARAVACPMCGAKPGGPCMRPSGHAVFGGGVHAPRERVFAAARNGRGKEPQQVPMRGIGEGPGEIPARDGHGQLGLPL